MGGRLQEFHQEHWVNLHRHGEVKLVSLGSGAFKDLEGA